MDRITVICPNCKKQFDVPRSIYLGNQARCDSCKQIFFVADLDASSEASLPVADSGGTGAPKPEVEAVSSLESEPSKVKGTLILEPNSFPKKEWLSWAWRGAVLLTLVVIALAAVCLTYSAGGIRKQVTDVATALEKVRGDVSSTQSKLSDVESEISDIKRAVSEMGPRLSGIENTGAAAKGRLRDIESRVANVEGGVRRLQAGMGDGGTDISGLEAKLDTMQKELSKIEKDLPAIKTAISKMKSDISSIENNVSHFRLHGVQIDK